MIYFVQFLIKAVLILILLTGIDSRAASSLCLEGICIGDNVDALNVQWKKVKVNFKAKRAIKTLMLNQTMDELYYEYNEQLVTDQPTLKKLLPYIIQLQKFDADALKWLSKVKAICSPLSLTGEVENNSKTKMFVTFKAVADHGGRGRLRVVQLEKEFNIYPPHIRPSDRERYVSMLTALKQDFPKLKLVRDIDARATTNELAFANTILGFRFYSDVNAPLTFRVRDLADIESIEISSERSSSCPELED